MTIQSMSDFRSKPLLKATKQQLNNDKWKCTYAVVVCSVPTLFGKMLAWHSYVVKWAFVCDQWWLTEDLCYFSAWLQETPIGLDEFCVHGWWTGGTQVWWSDSLAAVLLFGWRVCWRGIVLTFRRAVSTVFWVVSGVGGGSDLKKGRRLPVPNIPGDEWENRSTWGKNTH